MFLAPQLGLDPVVLEPVLNHSGRGCPGSVEPPQQPVVPRPVGDLHSVRRHVLLAVIAFNSQKLSSSSLCVSRMRAAAQLHLSIGKQPDTFISQGRSGNSLNDLIKQWASNDCIFVSDV